MAKKSETCFGFLSELREFLINYAISQFWIYSPYREQGALLVKNIEKNEKILFKPWGRENLIGANQLDEYVFQHNTFMGESVDKYVFIGKFFRPNAIRYARAENSVSLMKVDFHASEITLFGSMYTDNILLKTIFDFADSMKYHLTYDFRGMLRHQSSRDGKEQISKVETTMPNPVAFLSYSWDDESHKLWVLKLASDLIKNGVNVLIDEWDLKKYRNDFQYFMETGIKEADFVIMVCTRNYAERANTRVGGVGIENTIITGEFFDASKSTKYLPVVRDYEKGLKNSLPSYLKTKYSIDFQDDSKYEQNLQALLRFIFDIPKFERPTLGKIPDLGSESI